MKEEVLKNTKNPDADRRVMLTNKIDTLIGNILACIMITRIAQCLA